ncbi:HAMP domain-containing sensor histidine kinase [Lentisalinibacter orientalis]|uniref:HAMP domain-containing sensor histidine kinase n=1 Tax=Lentisalinibacter orientalis TaxID=2992241 RepID=UPI003862E696
MGLSHPSPGLAARLAVLVALVVILAVGTVTVFAVRNLQALAETEALTRAELGVSAGREAMRGWIDDMRRAASLLGERPTLRRLLTEGSDEATRAYLQDYCDSAGLEACVVTGSGDAVATEGSAKLGLPVPLDALERPGGLVLSRDGSRLLIVGAAPVSVSASSSFMVVVARGTEDWLTGRFSPRSGVEVSFLSRQAETGASRPFYQLDEVALSAAATASGPLSNAGGYGASLAIRGADGEAVGWLHARVPSEAVMRPVRTTTIRVLGVGLVVAIFATVLAVLLGRHWVGGVARLTDAARRLGAGDLSTPVNPETGRELGILSGTMEEMRRSLAELEAARRTRDTVLANISHEFRTPLTAQLASIELLRESTDETRPAEERELIASLERGAKRLTRLIDNLLESVRIESGQLAIRRQEVDLRAVVADALELIGPLIDQRRQQVEFRGLDDVPRIRGDHQRLTQVFVNLLANASKFGRDGGRIGIGCNGVRSDRVTVWVEDDGPGPREGDEAVLFGQFRRSHGPDPDESGLGLGLYIVRSIVARHAGRVRLVRTEEGMTRAVVELPLGGNEGECEGESDESPGGR